MLQKRFHMNQDWVLFPGHRTQNWMGLDDNNSRWCIENDRSKRKLFSRETKNGRTKITINPEILKTLEVELLKSIPKSIPQDHEIYYDTGYGKNNPLTKL